MRRPELLIPAGNLEKLRTALLYGADAVYVGVPGLSLRSTSAEISLDDLATGVSEAHGQHVKVYAALNTFARNTDLEQTRLLIPALIATGVDALILSDSVHRRGATRCGGGGARHADGEDRRDRNGGDGALRRLLRGDQGSEPSRTGGGACRIGARSTD